MAISTINQAGLNAPLTLTSPVLTTPNLGTPSAINLSNATALPASAMPAGCVIQTVAGTIAGQKSSTSSTPALGFGASITPQFSNSKILVMWGIYVSTNPGNNVGIYLQIRNGSTLLYELPYVNYNSMNGVGQMINMQQMNYLDSPATTSAVTYNVYFACDNTSATSYLNQYGSSNYVFQEIKQ